MILKDSNASKHQWQKANTLAMQAQGCYYYDCSSTLLGFLSSAAAKYAEYWLLKHP
jgi:hypothetical protein